MMIKSNINFFLDIINVKELFYKFQNIDVI